MGKNRHKTDRIEDKVLTQYPELMGDALRLGKIGIWQLNLETNASVMSEQVYRIHEVEVGTHFGIENGIQYYREDFRDLITQAVERAIETGEPYSVEAILVTGKGNEKWIRTEGQATFKDGKSVMLSGVIQDIHDQKLKEISAREQDVCIRGIFNGSKNFMGLMEPDGTMIEINTSGLELWNKTSRDIKGQKIYDLPWWSENEKANLKLKGSIEEATGGAHIQYDVELFPNRKPVFIDFSISPILDSEGKVKYLLAEGADISDRVEMQNTLQENLHQLRSFISHAPQEAVMLDTELRFLGVSKKWSEIYGLVEEDIIGKSYEEVLELIHKAPYLLPYYERALKGKRVENERVFILEPNGAKKWKEITVSPWHDIHGKPGGVIRYSNDITDQIEYQTRLDNLNQELEQQVEERTAQMRSLNKEMEQFVYIASHDLQEPLRTINSYSEILQEESGLSENQLFMLKRVSTAAIRMKSLVKDLLDYSRVGRIAEAETLDLRNLIEGITQDFGQVIKETEATIVIPELPELFAIQSDIRQLFQNLISNALKYRSDTAPPHIEIGFQIESGVFSLSDNGIGIEEKYEERIFQIFQRLHHREQYSGTGIGLAMCKKVVGRYNGKIWMRSTVGIGSTFYFTLPTALNPNLLPDGTDTQAKPNPTH